MRVLVIIALLGSTAAADPELAPRLTWIGGAGAGQVDGVTGLAAGWSMEFGIARRRSIIGIETGMGWVIPTREDVAGTWDVMLGLHARRRLGNLWAGGGVVAHRIAQLAPAVAARGHVEPASARWAPGVDLQLAYELRRDHEWLGCHLGLRAYVIPTVWRDDVAPMAKPLSQPPVVYGVDGGVVLELGYIYGR